MNCDLSPFFPSLSMGKLIRGFNDLLRVHRQYAQPVREEEEDAQEHEDSQVSLLPNSCTTRPDQINLARAPQAVRNCDCQGQIQRLVVLPSHRLQGLHSAKAVEQR